MKKITRTIFIASSTEDKETARLICEAINNCETFDLSFTLEPVHWEDTDFDLNNNNLQSLVEFPQKYDYGCFLFTPNDTTIYRNIATKRVRDNVLLEFGLFVSQEDGLKKAFIVHPKDEDLKLASDLQGVVTAQYDNSSNKEALKGKLQTAINRVFKAIVNFENKKIKQSDKAVKNSTMILRKRLHEANEDSQPEIILDALKNLAIIKAKALNQTACEVLKDILTWVNTLVDILDVDELAKLQSGNLKYVWVYSSMPIELNESLKTVKDRFVDIVHTNIERGVKYIYFIDSEELIPQIQMLYQSMPESVEVFILDSFCVTSDYAFHFYQNETFDVFQNIVRKRDVESLIRLDNEDAKILKNKIDSQRGYFTSSIENGISIFRKNNN